MSSLVPNVYAAIFTPVPLATLALALRLKARRMTRMGMGYDDVLAVAAWVRHDCSSTTALHAHAITTGFSHWLYS